MTIAPAGRILWPHAVAAFVLGSQLGSAQSLPPALMPCLAPPAGWVMEGKPYPSLLQRPRGASLESSEDWVARRGEILESWHGIMGPWPALLPDPALRILETASEDGYVRHQVEWPMDRRQTGLGYLLVPEGPGPFPGVVVPFYDPETSIGLGRPFRDFGRQLAKRGFVTLSIGSPGGDAREPSLGEATCQPLSYLAYIAANARRALAARPEVDARRIGIVGHSYGGKWAMFAACLDEGYACGVWSDPGIAFDETRSNVNYWDRWYLGAEPGKRRPPGIPDPTNPRAGAYKVLRERGHDLHELQALMAPRPFFVSGGAEDGPQRWKVLQPIIEVYALLGASDRVAMSHRTEHSPDEASNELIYQFLTHFLQTSNSSEKD